MTTLTVRVQRAARAQLQDLGRPGFASLGVPGNGAADQHAARTANVLVGNADDATLVEVTGSELVLRVACDVLVAVTGAAGTLLVDGHARPTWELVPVYAGATVTVPSPIRGLRSYLAFNGAIEATRALGSAAPDPLLGVGRSLHDGDEVVIASRYVAPRYESLPVFRLGARPTSRPVDGLTRIEVTPGPELARMDDATAVLTAAFPVLADSDQVGLRLGGPTASMRGAGEIVSRGVPVGAIEVTHSGGLIVLLRGRLVTAGYPVVAVASTASLDALGQLRPGDYLTFSLRTAADTVASLRALDAERSSLSARVQAALTARGLGDIVTSSQPAPLGART